MPPLCFLLYIFLIYYFLLAYRQQGLTFILFIFLSKLPLSGESKDNYVIIPEMENKGQLGFFVLFFKKIVFILVFLKKISVNSLRK